MLRQEKKFLFNNSYDVNIICKELFKKTKISYFDYQMYYDDGNALILTSCPEYIESYVNNKLFVTLSERLALKKLGIRYVFMSEDMVLPGGASDKNPGKYLTNIITSMQYKIYHRIYRCTHHIGYFKLCGFGIDHDSKSIFETYINITDTLESFILEFEEKANFIINQKGKNRIIFPGYCDLGEKHIKNTHIKNTHILSCSSFTPWLKILPTSLSFGVHEKPIYLTHRELESLLLKNVLGYTAKEIASMLDISYRTVQQHLYNAKDKIGSKNKQELRRALLDNSYCKVLLSTMV